MVTLEKYPYATAPNTLRKFLKGIPEKAVPEKVTQRYLESIGMKSKNDRTIIPVLKFVGLLDGSGIPTGDYKTFRDKSKGPGILANLIRTAYKDLYSTYEDAHSQSDEALSNYFHAKSELGERAIGFQLATFKALSEFGDFKGIVPTSQVGPAGITPAPGVTPVSGVRPEIHINLQIHLPESKDSSVYESIFQAIAKHLLKGS